MKPRSQKNTDKFLEVAIERIVPDGYGIGFAEGLTVFVPLAAAGDKLKVKVDRSKGKVAFASIVEIIESSPDRIEPPCPYFGRCGGCDFQQMNYAAQLRAKVGIVKDALRRIGKIDWQPEIEIVPSPLEWNYRTRVQWKHDAGRLGYFERNSHRVADIEICPILSPALESELEHQREEIKTKSFNFGQIQAVSGGKQVSRQFSDKNDNFDENFYAANKETEEKEIAKNAFDNLSEEAISIRINEFAYKFSAKSFFQVNHEILPQFLESVIGNAAGNLALDLYCGVGLFSLPLAKRFAQVMGIEGNAASIEFAKASAAASLTNINFETAWVGDWLRQNGQNLTSVDLVLLDPPRTGAERETIESLISLRPAQIVYVSCNPTTLARDLKMLIESNIFAVEQITAFDFFPQTHHVETVVYLRKIN